MKSKAEMYAATPAADTAPDAELELVDVGRFFDGVVAVERCNLAISRGEIIALLGASGCGKSTLLNLIAGFETPDTGIIRLRGRVLNDVPPHRRNTAMVFQHYALFPHLTVARNIAYGIESRGLDPATRTDRVNDMLALLKLDGLSERYPSQLSGGQRQRVAIARALAVRPDVLLLDEAFSALDRNLREEMQVELSLLLRRLNVTTILVTHDQREAFSLADRIAVMQSGRIAQVDTPRSMYENPSDSHVMRFLGSINALKATLHDTPGGKPRVRLGEALEFEASKLPRHIAGRRELLVYVRAEDITIEEQPSAVHVGPPATVTLSTFLGSQERLVLSCGDQQIIIDRPANARGQVKAMAGRPVYLDFDPACCRLAVTD
ncbi:MAG TPA: ABC transporter ATP-binding protein [Bradyrhizobium sp.]|nr:ABC transporter ATP-binding protein [Bradyrhizobium sp.]